MKVRFTAITSTAIVPKYASDGASGLDLHADMEHILQPGQRCLVQTGIAIELPAGFEAQVRPRSGLALKSGITVLNAPGTVDADYRGNIGVILYNAGERAFVIDRGDRIAQLVIAPVTRVELEEADGLSGSERGQGGFGSTGVK